MVFRSHAPRWYAFVWLFPWAPACGWQAPPSSAPLASSPASTFHAKRVTNATSTLVPLGDRWLVWAQARPHLLFYPKCHGGMTVHHIVWEVLEFASEQDRNFSLVWGIREAALSTQVLDIAQSTTAYGFVGATNDDAPACHDYVTDLNIPMALQQNMRTLTGSSDFPTALRTAVEQATDRLKTPLDPFDRVAATATSHGGYLLLEVTDEAYAFQCSVGFLDLAIPGVAETAVTSAHCLQQNGDFYFGTGSVSDGDTTAVSWAVTNPYFEDGSFDDVAILASRAPLRRSHKNLVWPSINASHDPPFWTVGYGRPATGKATQWSPDHVEWYSDLAQIFKGPSGTLTYGDSGSVLSDSSDVAWAVASKANRIQKTGETSKGSIWTSLIHNHWMAGYAASLISQEAPSARGDSTKYLTGAAPPRTVFGEPPANYSPEPFAAGSRAVNFGDLKAYVLPWDAGPCEGKTVTVPCGRRFVLLSHDVHDKATGVVIYAQWQQPVPPYLARILTASDTTAFSVHIPDRPGIPACPETLLSCEDPELAGTDCPCSYSNIEGASAAILRLVAERLGQEVEDLPSDKRSDLDNLIRSVR